MNIKSLQDRLEQAPIPASAYSLTGGLPNEAYCISLNGSVWEVYYSERGMKSGLRTFDSEADACQYFWDWISKEVA